jgi:1,2-diacylglycerol 3-alpha-glucosyltransferase
MKIYFVSKGANWQKYRLEVLTKLAQTYNHNIEILTTGVIKDYLSDNEYIKYITFRSIFPQKWKISFMPGILIYILRNKPDVILALNSVTNITEYLSLVLSKIINIKFIWWTHAYDHHKKKIYTEIKRIYTLFFLRLADCIITFSQKGKDYLLRNGFREEKIFVAPNTLDTSKILKQIEFSKSQNSSDILQKLGLNITSKILLFSGRLNKEKKVDNAIKACGLVVNKIPEILLVIIGDGEEFISLKDFAEKTIPYNVIFLGPIFNDSILNQWFSISKLFIMPGYVGLAIIHAFCYSLPLITEDISYHSPEIQYLKNGYNGFLVEENNIQQLADKIIELLSDETKRSSFAENALHTAQNEGSIENMVNSMNNALLA